MKKNNILTSFVHYSYFRYYLHIKKQWDNSKSISQFNLSFGFTYSAGALIGLIIFLIDDFFNIERYVPILIIVSISIITIATFFLPNVGFLENKYKDYDRTSKDWKIKGVLALAFVFCPPILLIIYIILNIPN